MANTKSGASSSHDVFFKLEGYEQHIQLTPETTQEDLDNLFAKARTVIDWLKDVGAVNKYDTPKSAPSEAGKGAAAMERAAATTGFAAKSCPVDGEPMKFVFKTGKMRSNAYVCETCGKWVNP